MSSIISVQLDALEVLAGELRVLAGELDDDAGRCSGASGALAEGLSQLEGLTAIGAARTWAALATAVADGTRAVAGVLSAAVASYREIEAARAASIGRVRTDHPAVVW